MRVITLLAGGVALAALAGTAGGAAAAGPGLAKPSTKAHVLEAKSGTRLCGVGMYREKRSGRCLSAYDKPSKGGEG